MDAKSLKQDLVNFQLVNRGITDQKILSAFLKVDRHEFIPEANRSGAYGDFPVPIGYNQTISQPYIVALMTQSLDLVAGQNILEIGTGCGYQTAILLELGLKVYSIERIEALAKQARSNLEKSGYRDFEIITADGSLGWPQDYSFDRILIAAYSAKVPEPLILQLKECGKMILPLGEQSAQMLTLVEKERGQLKFMNLCSCVFVPLLGKFV